MSTVLHHPGELRVYADPEQLARAAAELFVRAASESVGVRGRFRVALSGGATPRVVYKLLATARFSSRIDWNRVDLFWGDERYVPPDHPDSNYRMTAESLLEHVPLPAANIHRIPTEVSPPSSAAAAYECEIRQSFEEAHSVPRFDLIYLGLGANGHTASLFPHSPALHETSRLILADFVSELNSWRVSMSVPLLNRGRTVAFLIQGSEKAQVLSSVRLGPSDPEDLPAEFIVPEGKLLWMADEAAAALVRDLSERRSA